MVNIEYFRDRDEIASLPCDLVILMQKKGLIAHDQNLVHYCGFISWQRGIAVFMPRNTILESLLPHDAFYLFQSLSRYYLRKRNGIFEGKESDLIGKYSLYLVHSLIEDYRANGLYVRKKNQSSINKGRPNWKLTIARRTPYPSGNDPVYIDTDTISTSYVSDCQTARIHAHVIRQIYIKYGVIVTGNHINSDDGLDRVPEPNVGSESQIAILDRELLESYSERDINLIGMLKSYICESSSSGGSEFLVGTQNFHNVWEGMLDACLPRKIEINRALPVPYYQQGDYFIEVSQKGQRTDTVIESEDGYRWAIIDAKYYDASSPFLAPGWHDLVKQFFYKIAAERICDQNVVITLHFVFPGRKKILHKAKVGMRNQKTVATTEFIEIEGHGEILCHYCDPITLLEKYACCQLLDINNKEHISESFFTDIDTK
ncbi:LlaJI family restriction endonuclease [Vibrio cholerae]|nr:LlaJI family restriction endonuclease [Vibrio cholerae]EJL6846401.1 LlaJI family restriction endonuclease [Vibrio cholerae]EKF9813410.1 LlaJI family restriction endonuclease [Vibrio cholerae]